MAEIHRSAGVRASVLEYLHACPICEHPQLRHYCRVPSRFNQGEFIRYERCGGCGTVLRNPRLPGNYRLHRYATAPVPHAEEQLDRRKQAHYRHVIRVIDRLLPPPSPRRLLDFGCGTGGFLRAAREGGFDAVGVEVNRDTARFVEETRGIPVYPGLPAASARGGKQFNVIVSLQVFEHLVDPRATLRELRGHLAAPGLILIEVPNLHDFRERLRRGTTMDDAHLFYFHRRSLQQLLAQAGFHVLRIEEGLRPHGVLGARADGAPLGLLRVAERLLSGCQLKTGLSVLARLGLRPPERAATGGGEEKTPR